MGEGLLQQHRLLNAPNVERLGWEGLQALIHHRPCSSANSNKRNTVQVGLARWCVAQATMSEELLEDDHCVRIMHPHHPGVVLTRFPTGLTANAICRSLEVQFPDLFAQAPSPASTGGHSESYGLHSLRCADQHNKRPAAATKHSHVGVTRGMGATRGVGTARHKNMNPVAAAWEVMNWIVDASTA